MGPTAVKPTALAVANGRPYGLYARVSWPAVANAVGLTTLIPVGHPDGGVIPGRVAPNLFEQRICEVNQVMRRFAVPRRFAGYEQIR